MTDNENRITGVISAHAAPFELRAGMGREGRGLTIAGEEQLGVTNAVLTVPASGLPELVVNRIVTEGSAAGEAVITAFTRLLSRLIHRRTGGESLPPEPEGRDDLLTGITAASYIPGSETLSGSCAVAVGNEIRRARFVIVVSPEDGLAETTAESVIRVAGIERLMGIEGIEGGADRARHDDPEPGSPNEAGDNVHIDAIRRIDAIRSVAEGVASEAIRSDGEVWAGVTTIPGPFGKERYSYLIAPIDARGAVSPIPPGVAEIRPSTVGLTGIPLQGEWTPEPAQVDPAQSGEGQGEAWPEGEAQANGTPGGAK